MSAFDSPSVVATVRMVKRVIRVADWTIESREYFVLVGVIAAGCLGSYALNWTGSDYLKNLGPNLLAGFVGSAVTIFGFDVILRRRQERLNLPIRAAIYFDIKRLTEAALGVEFKAIDDAEDRAGDAQTWTQLLSAALAGDILSEDDRNAWLLPIKEASERILERYVGLLQPTLVRELQVVASTEYAYIRGYGKTLGLLTPGAAPSGNWMDAIHALHKWTHEEYARLKGRVRIRQPVFPLVMVPIALLRQRRREMVDLVARAVDGLDADEGGDEGEKPPSIT